MINLYESYVAELGFELVTPGSTARWARLYSPLEESTVDSRYLELAYLE